jgi:hypothetical protein
VLSRHSARRVPAAAPVSSPSRCAPSITWRLAGGDQRGDRDCRAPELLPRPRRLPLAHSREAEGRSPALRALCVWNAWVTRVDGPGGDDLRRGDPAHEPRASGRSALSGHQPARERNEGRRGAGSAV